MEVKYGAQVGSLAHDVAHIASDATKCSRNVAKIGLVALDSFTCLPSGHLCFHCILLTHLCLLSFSGSHFLRVWRMSLLPWVRARRQTCRHVHGPMCTGQAQAHTDADSHVFVWSHVFSYKPVIKLVAKEAGKELIKDVAGNK